MGPLGNNTPVNISRNEEKKPDAAVSSKPGLLTRLMNLFKTDKPSPEVIDKGKERLDISGSVSSAKLSVPEESRKSTASPSFISNIVGSFRSQENIGATARTNWAGHLPVEEMHGQDMERISPLPPVAGAKAEAKNAKQKKAFEFRDKQCTKFMTSLDNIPNTSQNYVLKNEIMKQIVNLQMAEDPAKIKKVAKQIGFEIAIIKTDSQKNKIFIAAGKAKMVWKVAGNTETAYFTPVKGFLDFIYNSKKAEIQAEVKTASTIQKNLLLNVLNKVLGDPENNERVASALIKEFNTIDNILRNIEAIELNPQALLDKYPNDQNIANGMVYALFALDSANLREELQNLTSNIAVDLVEVKGNERVGSGYTVKTQQAAGDLEDKMKDKALNFRERVALGGQVLNGLNSLQVAGMIHGDMKPDNFLVKKNPKYNPDTDEGQLESEYIVQASDFGKTKPMGDDETSIHTGNLRYNAPEGNDSKKSEVFSAGLVLIRVLEESILGEDRDTLPTASTQLDAKATSKGRRGVEKFLVQNKATSQKDGMSVLGRVKNLVGNIVSDVVGRDKEFADSEREINLYLNSLRGELLNNKEAADQLGISLGVYNKKIIDTLKLLTDMTKSDPEDRISLHDALRAYREIWT